MNISMDTYHQVTDVGYSTRLDGDGSIWIEAEPEFSVRVSRVADGYHFLTRVGYARGFIRYNHAPLVGGCQSADEAVLAAVWHAADWRQRLTHIRRAAELFRRGDCFAVCGFCVSGDWRQRDDNEPPAWEQHPASAACCFLSENLGFGGLCDCCGAHQYRVFIYRVEPETGIVNEVDGITELESRLTKAKARLDARLDAYKIVNDTKRHTLSPDSATRRIRRHTTDGWQPCEWADVKRDDVVTVEKVRVIGDRVRDRDDRGDPEWETQAKRVTHIYKDQYGCCVIDAVAVAEGPEGTWVDIDVK